MISFPLYDYMYIYSEQTLIWFSLSNAFLLPSIAQSDFETIPISAIGSTPCVTIAEKGDEVNFVENFHQCK